MAVSGQLLISGHNTEWIVITNMALNGITDNSLGQFINS